MDDALTARILEYLGDRYLPVQGDWVELPAMAASLRIECKRLVTRCEALAGRGLIELAAPDADDDSYAAIITARGLLAIGRAP
jgi:hypothetical protein